MNQSETSKFTPLDMLVWLTLAVTSSLLFTFYILSLLCKISYQNTLNFNLLFHTHDCRMTSSRAISLILLTDVLYLFRTTQDFAGHVSDKHPKSHRPPELEVSGGPAHCQGHERLPKTQVWQCVMTRVFFFLYTPPPRTRQTENVVLSFHQTMQALCYLPLSEAWRRWRTRFLYNLQRSLCNLS